MRYTLYLYCIGGSNTSIDSLTLSQVVSAENSEDDHGRADKTDETEALTADEHTGSDGDYGDKIGKDRCLRNRQA